MTGEEHGKMVSRRWFAMVDRLPPEKRERFLESGPTVPCQIGVEGGCYHLECQVKAGALPQIVIFNSWFRDQSRSNWLRFLDTATLVKLYWVFKAEYQRTGEVPWLAAVHAGVMAA